MKKLLLIMMVFCCGILLVGCNKENTKEEKDTNNTEEKETVKNKVVVDGDKITIDGAILKEMDVIDVNGVFNLSVVFDNSDNEAVKVDLGKFIVKKGNKKMTVFSSDIKEIEANQSHTQYGYPLDDTDDLKVGDEVEIYYGKTKLGTTEVFSR